MCTPSPAQVPVLGAWVHRHTEQTRDGRTLVVLLNRRDRVALTVSAEEEAALLERVSSGRPGSPVVEDLLVDLRDGGFLAGSGPGTRPSRAARAATALADLQVRWTRGDRLVQALHRAGGGRLFERRAVLVQVVLALVGVVAVAHAVAGADQVHYRVGAGALVWVLGLSTAAITVHELAHGVGVARAGRRVDAIGAGLHLGSPVCFVEAVDGLTMTRRERLAQAAAGPWAEWLFTSVAALALLAVHGGTAETVLHRFVVVNAFVVVSNLLPFVGLDGYLIFSDLVRMPDLAARSTGAPGRVVADLLAGRHTSRTDRWLAAYRLANNLVALALLAVSALMWAALFGPSLAGLAAEGPAGWLALLALTVLLGRPVVRTSGPRVVGWVRSAVDLAGRIRFRSQWGWRIAATQVLAATPAYADHDERALGEVAGLLRRTPARKVGVVTSAAVVQRGRVGWAGQLLTTGDLLPAGARPTALTRGARLVLAPTRPETHPFGHGLPSVVRVSVPEHEAPAARERRDRPGRPGGAARPGARPDGPRPVGVARGDRPDLRRRPAAGVPDPASHDRAAPRRLGRRSGVDAGLGVLRRHLAPRRRPAPVAGAQGAVGDAGGVRRPCAVPPRARRGAPADRAAGASRPVPLSPVPLSLVPLSLVRGPRPTGPPGPG